jgi:hypothetical protein
MRKRTAAPAELPLEIVGDLDAAVRRALPALAEMLLAMAKTRDETRPATTPAKEHHPQQKTGRGPSCHPTGRKDQPMTILGNATSQRKFGGPKEAAPG